MSSPVLIEADELRDLLDSGANVCVLDVRWQLGGPDGATAFGAGHVPGSVYVDLEQDLAAPPGEGGRHPLPSAEDFQAAMRRVGLRADEPVVVIDEWQGRSASRLWWLLRHHGHDRVRVLNGGLTAWRAIGGVLETDETVVVEGDFVAAPGRADTVEADRVQDVDVLVDARNPERYSGDVEPVDPVAGHIPGAVNVPTAANLAGDGRFRSSEELAERYGRAGVVPGADVAVYCGSGVTACHDLLALASVGVDAKLYPGSWSGWVTDPTRPVATGD